MPWKMISGRPQWNPNAKEIAEACALIQEDWSESQRLKHQCATIPERESHHPHDPFPSITSAVAKDGRIGHDHLSY